MENIPAPWTIARFAQDASAFLKAETIISRENRAMTTLGAVGTGISAGLLMTGPGLLSVIGLGGMLVSGMSLLLGAKCLVSDYWNNDKRLWRSIDAAKEMLQLGRLEEARNALAPFRDFMPGWGGAQAYHNWTGQRAALQLAHCFQLSGMETEALALFKKEAAEKDSIYFDEYFSSQQRVLRTYFRLMRFADARQQVEEMAEYLEGRDVSRAQRVEVQSWKELIDRWQHWEEHRAGIVNGVGPHDNGLLQEMGQIRKMFDEVRASGDEHLFATAHLSLAQLALATDQPWEIGECPFHFHGQEMLYGCFQMLSGFARLGEYNWSSTSWAFKAAVKGFAKMKTELLSGRAEEALVQLVEVLERDAQAMQSFSGYYVGQEVTQDDFLLGAQLTGRHFLDRGKILASGGRNTAAAEAWRIAFDAFADAEDENGMLDVSHAFDELLIPDELKLDLVRRIERLFP
ncbi:MAG: hypothetical protein HY540_05225 [Deltaproteobacteria bacterium]|nr:hypothetical protein [Deltaproteobacteria bacterium]